MMRKGGEAEKKRGTPVRREEKVHWSSARSPSVEGRRRGQNLKGERKAYRRRKKGERPALGKVTT